MGDLADLKLLELLLGAGVEDLGGGRVGSRALRRPQPGLEARVVVHELTPQAPGLLNPDRKEEKEERKERKEERRRRRSGRRRKGSTAKKSKGTK